MAGFDSLVANYPPYLTGCGRQAYILFRAEFDPLGADNENRLENTTARSFLPGRYGVALQAQAS